MAQMMQDLNKVLLPYETAVLGYLSDGRSLTYADHWFGSDLGFVVLMCGLYLAFVAVGSLIMSNRKDPITIPGAGMIYNFTQLSLSSYMFIESIMLAHRNGYTLTPGNAFSTTNPACAHLVWLFYMTKALDFFDTIQIVLGKRWRQLSFLHVYHHSSVFVVYWLNMRINYDGDIFLTITLNGFIHAIMYLYYFVSLHTKDIWWKKYLTMMQLVQFTCMLTQSSYMMLMGCDQAPPRMTRMYWVYIVSMMVLFLNFFLQTYTKKSDKKPKTS